jgi:hypothetical protein
MSSIVLHPRSLPFPSQPRPSQRQFGVPFEAWRLVNAMLPREYYPSLQEDNVLEARAHSIAQQLLGEDMALDYDQFLMKRPSR